MKELTREWKEKIETIFSEYGKVICVFVFLSVGLTSTGLIVSLIVPQKLRVSFLDVGQGDAIFIQTPSGKSMLIDGGASDVVLARLASKMNYFTRDIDVMVATHPDLDHVTGLVPVLEKYSVSTIVISPSEGDTQVSASVMSQIKNEKSDVYVARTGDVIDFHDGVTAQILYPSENYVGKKSDTNGASVSMIVMYGDKTFLLTGDLPSLNEPKLISALLSLRTSRESADSNITVYKAGHHGSKYSSGEQLLTYIHPEYAVVSAGKENKYGHPNVETIDRLQKYSKEILSTIDRGTISFVTDGRIVEVNTSR